MKEIQTDTNQKTEKDPEKDLMTQETGGGRDLGQEKEEEKDQGQGSVETRDITQEKEIEKDLIQEIEKKTGHT